MGLGIKIMKREEKIMPVGETDMGLKSARTKLVRDFKSKLKVEDATDLKEKTPEVAEQVKFSGPIQKPLSQGQIKRVIRISEKDNGSDKANARANKVLDRMKKRNIVK
jgi:hypothetical protein